MQSPGWLLEPLSHVDGKAGHIGATVRGQYEYVVAVVVVNKEADQIDLRARDAMTSPSS